MIKGFRDLRADEIECRIQSVKKNGLVLLLYKDARCDMNILDETVGVMEWKREHSRDNANCTVSLWDESKSMWVSKEDTVGCQPLLFFGVALCASIFFRYPH